MWPWFITTIRSAIDSASSWSWVTRIVVTPSRCCSARISPRSRTRSSASSADSGSSSSSSPGAVASARASAIRCCCPPESWPGILAAAVRQADQLQQLGDARADLVAALAPVDEPVGDVVEDGEVGKQRVRLEHDAVVALDRRQPGDVLAALHDRAGVLRLEPGDDPQQRGLAAARRPEKRHQLAAVDGERDVRPAPGTCRSSC